MFRWVLFLVLDKLVASIKDEDEDGFNLQKLNADKLKDEEDACNLQKVNIDVLNVRAAAPATATDGSKVVLLESQQQFSKLEAVFRSKTLPPLAETQPIPADAGHIKSVYTFAAPALTKRYQLVDGRQADGIFPGMRVWTESPHEHHDIVSRAMLWFQHPKMVSIKVQVGDANGSITIGKNTRDLYNGVLTKVDPKVPGTDTAFLPRAGVPCVNILRCHLDYYFQRYATLGVPELDIYWRFSSDVYEDWSLEVSKHEAKHLGYRMIGLGHIPPRESLFVKFDKHDSIHLYQHELSRECVLAFEGSDLNSWHDWSANFQVTTEQYCGFPLVHHGLADKLRYQLLTSQWTLHIAPKLPSCANVTVTGHSQGGALAVLFAACVNRAMLPADVRGQADYNASSWTASSPRLLDEWA